MDRMLKFNNENGETVAAKLQIITMIQQDRTLRDSNMTIQQAVA